MTSPSLESAHAMTADKPALKHPIHSCKLKFQSLWPLALLVAVSAAVYANSLSNGFVFDDRATIVENVHIAHPAENLPSLLTRRYYKIANGESSYRPVATLSYYLLYALCGLEPFGYHLFSLALHIFNVLLVYRLAGRLNKNRTLPLAAALLFACHPVLTEAVDCISYNDDLLAAFFFFLSLQLYFSLKHDTAKHRGYLLGLSLACYLLGLLSKEMALTLPLIIFIYDWTLAKPDRRPFRLASLLQTLYEQRYDYLAYGAVTLFYLWIRFAALSNPQAGSAPVWGSLVERIIYLPVLFFTYLRLLLLPLSLNADYVFSYPAGFLEAYNLAAFALTAALAAFSFWSYRRWPLIAFGIWWFFITLLPVYNIIPLFNPIAERYLYIPMFGFCLAAATLIGLAARWVHPRAATASTVVLLLVLTVFYAAVAINRNRDWHDGYRLWTRTLETAPDSVKAHGNLASIYMDRGQVAESLEEIKKTVALNPKDYKAYYNLGILLARQERIDDAIAAYKKAIARNPAFANAHFNVANLYKQRNMLAEAAREYEKTLQIDGRDIQARNNLGVIYAMQGKLEDAVRQWQKVLEIEPANRMARGNLAKARKLLQKNKSD